MPRPVYRKQRVKRTMPLESQAFGLAGTQIQARRASDACRCDVCAQRALHQAALLLALKVIFRNQTSLQRHGPC